MSFVRRNRGKVSIIATQGPACNSASSSKVLVQSGVSIIRINASHTNPKTLVDSIQKINRTFKTLKQKPKIMVDLQGPRVRTGKLVSHRPIHLKKKDSVRILIGDSPGESGLITTPCRDFAHMVRRGDTIMIDNGSVQLRVRTKTTKQIQCSVVTGGLVGENKGINLPHARPALPALTRKDLTDLEAILPLRYDAIALSFVRTAEDILTLRNWLKVHNKRTIVIAKIEKPAALKNLTRIIKVSDEILIARGDLGIELGIEKVPLLQKKIIQMTKHANKRVIVATQMLESMMQSPNPSRAEVSDVANAVLDGANAVMLSGETAIGDYPIESVRMMKKIIDTTLRDKNTARLIS